MTTENLPRPVQKAEGLQGTQLNTGGGPPRGAVFGRGLTVAPWVMKEKKGVGSLFRRKGVGFSGRRKDSRPLFWSALFGKRSYCEKITPLVDGGARASGDTGPDRGRLLCPLLDD